MQLGRGQDNGKARRNLTYVHGTSAVDCYWEQEVGERVRDKECLRRREGRGDVLPRVSVCIYCGMGNLRSSTSLFKNKCVERGNVVAIFTGK